MISIKKLVEGDWEAVSRSALDRYRSVLKAIGQSGMQACPSVGARLHQNLLHLQAALSPDPTSELIEKTGRAAETEITGWGSEAAEYFKRRAEDGCAT